MTVVADRHIMSAEYRQVAFHFWPKLTHASLNATLSKNTLLLQSAIALPMTITFDL